LQRDPDQVKERTTFQTSRSYDDSIDIKSDVVMVYGIDKGLPDRIESWREQGYVIHVMTGVSWGQYQDYLYGKWDGNNHEDDAQTIRNGKKRSHGGDVYYMCPSESYGEYLTLGVKQAIDSGALAIFLEEPEFWVNSGYSDSFKREWKSYYKEKWIPPHESCDAQYRASKLKYYLYQRALGQVFQFVIEYGKKIGKKISCYVPTHSLINYAHWKIISPESSLMGVPGCDGYIAQVWTGTSRTPNVYQGKKKERTFETAFLEYGIMFNLTRATGRRMWFLNDPIEDNPNHTWEDYRINWESTLVASLMWPEIWRFETMPWPNRIFNGQYPSKTINFINILLNRVKKVGIPPKYATELITVINTLNDMQQDEIQWDCGTQGIGILISDTLMFQRGNPSKSDPNMGHIYGLALPLIKHGIPVHPVQLENVSINDYLSPYKVLLLSYEGQKPNNPQIHHALKSWVQKGGILVYFGNDEDPYHQVREWWNTGDFKYTSPRKHLIETLFPGKHIGNDQRDLNVGEGKYKWIPHHPLYFTRSTKNAQTLRNILEEIFQEIEVPWRETNYLLLRRGPYLIGAGLDESLPSKPKVIEGNFMDLFDPNLEIRTRVVLSPGVRILLLDLEKISHEKPKILASASKVTKIENDKGSLKFHSEGPSNTMCVTRIFIPNYSKKIKIETEVESEIENMNSTILLRYPNNPKGEWISIIFQ
jgi:hypothetical protein